MTTLLDAIEDAIRAAIKNYDRGDTIPPVALLWPDPTGEWQPVATLLREERGLPIITLGDYDPGRWQGPAIYLRCLIEGTLPEAGLPDDETPIIYLPGHSRIELRNIGDCPEPLRPLAELQYRGAIWSHRNGRDWTVAGFLQAHLDIATTTDQETKAALRSTVGKLCNEPLRSIRAHQPLNAAYLASLTQSDYQKQILLWMNSPQEEKERIGAERWPLLRYMYKADYGFDPHTDGVATAAVLLASQDQRWAQVWERYRENPHAYPNIPTLLRNAEMPPLPMFRDSWPQINETMEDALRQALLNLRDASHDEARQEILRLEAEHGERRSWVWADLGESPLAFALQHLARLAELTEDFRFSGTIPEQAERYAREYWKADDAIVRALACVEKRQDREAVTAAIRTLARAWLEALATAFQQEWLASPPEQQKESWKPPEGEVLLFVDGLRMDLGHRLLEHLKEAGCSCTLTHRLAVLPSITETAKPAVMPIAGELAAGKNLTPATRTGAVAQISALRTLLREQNIQVLGENDDGDPEGRAWTECGNIDREGHDKGSELPSVLDGELATIERRIIDLLDAGWQQVRVVTDHGWLLLPGGLVKTDLPPSLVASKKGRYAELLPDSSVSLPTVAWFWNRTHRIALAPGITCFEAGKEYDHGGLSPQEVVVPEIIVTRGSPGARSLVIQTPSWRGLRCYITIEGGGEGYTVDIRQEPGDPKTSVAMDAKTTSPEGEVSLVIPNDSLEGTGAMIVVLDKDGNTLAQRQTIIGGE
ncbi:MAG: BREX-1 system phosphatase PglZ type B [Candidatus Methanoculleus thermohydrogenotrophicum]